MGGVAHADPDDCMENEMLTSKFSHRSLVKTNGVDTENTFLQQLNMTIYYDL